MPLDRRILVPCDEWTPAAAKYATLGGGEDGERQERGPAPGIATRDPEAVGNVDMRLAKFAGIPVRRHLVAEALVHVAGDIERGRFLWKRTSDPYWKGKSDYCDLAHTMVVENASSGAFYHHPYLVPLSNGDLLVLYTTNGTSDATKNNWLWYSRLLSPTMGLTSPQAFPTPVNGGVAVDRAATIPAIASICAAEDPNVPGRLVAVGCGDVENDATPSANEDLVVYTSNDYGRTWRISAVHRAFTGASNYSYGASLVYSGSRLVLAVMTAAGLALWYSNNHGLSWTASVQDTLPTGNSGGATLFRCVNGALVCVIGVAAGSSACSATWSGDNGATWRLFNVALITVVNSDAGSKGYWPSGFVDDAGYPCLYWTAYKDATPNDFRGLLFTRAGVRGITLTEVDAASSIFNTFDTVGGFGGAQNAQQVVYDDDVTLYDISIREVAACNWRGRAAVLVNYEDTQRQGLALSFAGQWVDLRHKVYPTRIAARSSWRYDYLPLGLPDSFGTTGYAWTLGGTAATVGFTPGGGFFMGDNGAASHFYTSPALGEEPYLVRFLVRVHSGGDLAADDVFVDAANATDDLEWQVRLSTAGFVLYDVNAAAIVGAPVASDMTKWHEIEVEVSSDSFAVQVYWRKLDPELDEHPAFNELFEPGAHTLDNSVPVATARLAFGLTLGANAVVEWRQVAHHRTRDTTIPVSRWDPANSLQLATFSAGNYLITSSDMAPELSDLPTNVADGLAVQFTGAGAFAGDRWDFETRAEHALQLVCEGGAARGYMAERSSLPSTGAEQRLDLVFDADPFEEGRRFRAGALAVFGCNWPRIRVQMNDADYWAAGATPVEVVVDFDPTTARRSEKWRTTTPSIATVRVVASVDGNAVKLTAVSMRPHQFRPRGGRTWYVSEGQDETNEGHVWRVLDNSDDTLYLGEQPGALIVAGNDLVVFSDRVLVDLTQSALGGVDDSVGYRFLNISTSGLVSVHDGAEGLKVGRVVLGRMSQIVDPEWGFSIRTIPGVSVQSSQGGQLRGVRLGPDLDRYELSWNALPPQVRDDDSPAGELSVWERVRDLLHATRMGRDSCVLVMNGAGLGQTSYLRATGDDVALVRLVGGFDARHEAYFPIENCGTDSTDHIGPLTALDGVVFQEEG